MEDCVELPRNQMHRVWLSDLYAAYHNDYIQIILSMGQERPVLRPPINPLKHDFFLARYKEDRQKHVSLEGLPFALQARRLECALAARTAIIFRPQFRNHPSRVAGHADALYHRDLVNPTSAAEYYLAVMETSKKTNRFNEIKASFLHTYALRQDAGVDRGGVVIHNLVTGAMRYFRPSATDIEQVRELVSRVRRAKRQAFGFHRFQFLPKYAYPNMKHDSIVWEEQKKEIARRLGEITQVWGCTLPYRENAFRQKMYSIFDPVLDASALGFDNYKQPIVDAIISVNRDPGKEFIVHNQEPIRALSGVDDLIFVDFEWIDRVYLVGAFDGQNYIAFWADSLSDEDVDRMWQAVVAFLKRKTVVYWYAEKSKFEKDCPFLTRSDHWIDLCGVFRNSTAVRGSMDFKLKSIGRSFYDLGYMPYFIDSFECQNGAQSISMASMYYESGDEGKKEAIERYNRFDCESMYHIAEKLKSLV